VFIEASSAKIMLMNQLHTGALFNTNIAKMLRPISLSGITRINIFPCPIRSEILDQYGVEMEITIEATALSAPAKAYESLTETTMKINANESIDIGIRPISAATENFMAPGVRNKVAYAENMSRSLCQG